MTPATPAKGLIALLRLPYWLMTGGLAVLTAFAILKGNFSNIPTTLGNMGFGVVALLAFFSMAFIASAGFAINDYFDRESDAVIKPKRPIPSGALSYKQAIAVSGVLFALGLVLSSFINWLSFAIIAIDSLLLLVYSYLVKRKSGFAANLLMGVLTGTAFIYGQATVTGTVDLVSLSLYPIAFGTIGGNVLRDIFSVEGDAKVGYPTLPQKIGTVKRSKSRRRILPIDGYSCSTSSYSYLRGTLHHLLFAANSTMECSFDLLINTSIHFKFNHSEYTQDMNAW